VIENINNSTNECVYSNELHNDENMKKNKITTSTTIHTNISRRMNTTMRKIFQRARNLKHQNYQRKNKDSNGQMPWIQHYILC
jgi:hypothetical protein